MDAQTDLSAERFHDAGGFGEGKGRMEEICTISIKVSESGSDHHTHFGRAVWVTNDLRKDNE